MKRLLFLVAFFLTAAIFLWWLTPSASFVPLATRVAYRTNDSRGQARYFMAVTNISPVSVLVRLEGEFFSTGLPVSSGIPAEARLRSFELQSNAELVVACALTEARGGKVKMLYYPRSMWGEQLWRIRTALRIIPDGPPFMTQKPQTLVINLPPE